MPKTHFQNAHPNMNELQPWCFFANCIPVKGAVRAIICDLQRGALDLVPNALYDMVTKYPSLPIQKIKAAYSNAFDDTISEYFTFLVQKEYIFFTDTPEQFPPLNFTWDYAGEISNAIIDIEDMAQWQPTLIRQLDGLGCQYVQLRFYRPQAMDGLHRLLHWFDGTGILYIEILMPDNGFLVQAIEHLCDQYPRLQSVVVHSVLQNEGNYTSSLEQKPFAFVKQPITSHKSCGVISPKFFALNIPTFSEAQQFNTCLNRKVAIDVDGNIKNCPSMPTSYGNIANTTLAVAIHKAGFKDYWAIIKNQIAVCKDCEFRHICTDCRAYLTNPDDIYSKPLKCGYNPYTNEWADWSDNPLSKAAIAYYGLQG
jgi:SPASM domain peptide maturase of grasp-with-spasm system